MKKSLFFGLFMGLALASASAQQVQLSGVLQHKEWSKSLDSYCIGGSDYYVLAQKNGEIALLDLSKWSDRKKRRWVNRSVVLKGRWREGLKTASDPFAQQPTNAPLCRIFEAE